MIGVRALATVMPDRRETIADAVADGRLPSEEAERSGYRSIPVAGPELPGPVLAAEAGRRAVAGVDPSRIGLLLHAWTTYQGHDLWSPAHHVADAVGARAALPVGIQQLSNGSAAAVELASSWLRGADGDLALVTTGDRFCAPGFDRWRSDRGLVHADAGTAILLGRDPAAGDPMRILSLVSSSAPHLERMHRGDDDFGNRVHHTGAPIDLARTKKAFFAAHSREAFTDTAIGHARDVVRRAIDEAGLAPDDPSLRRLALPRIGRLSKDLYQPVFAEITTADVVDLGCDTGHLGAGDLLANMLDLCADLAAGERAVVFNGGGGYTWTAVVVERGEGAVDPPETLRPAATGARR